MKCSTATKKVRADKRKRDAIRESEGRRLREEVPSFLREHGPTEFSALAEALHATRGRLAMVGKTLTDNGEIHRYRISQSRDSRRMWSVTPPPKREPKPVRTVKRAEIGTDPEDLAWMERQHRNAEERKARHERMAHW